MSRISGLISSVLHLLVFGYWLGCAGTVLADEVTADGRGPLVMNQYARSISAGAAFVGVDSPAVDDNVEVYQGTVAIRLESVDHHLYQGTQYALEAGFQTGGSSDGHFTFTGRIHLTGGSYDTFTQADCKPGAGVRFDIGTHLLGFVKAGGELGMGGALLLQCILPESKVILNFLIPVQVEGLFRNYLGARTYGLPENEKNIGANGVQVGFRFEAVTEYGNLSFDAAYLVNLDSDQSWDGVLRTQGELEIYLARAIALTLRSGYEDWLGGTLPTVDRHSVLELGGGLKFGF